MSDCSVSMEHPDAGETIGMLNERNRRLCVVAREMYKRLQHVPLSLDVDRHDIKRFENELKDLGVL